MSQQNYELTTNGVNAATKDYINMNWKEFSYLGIEKDKILGFEEVNVFIQREFTGVGTYCFLGDARPQLSNGNGYTTTNWRFSGSVSIVLNQDGSLFVKWIDGAISFTKN